MKSHGLARKYEGTPECSIGAPKSFMISSGKYQGRVSGVRFRGAFQGSHKVPKKFQEV